MEDRGGGKQILPVQAAQNLGWVPRHRSATASFCQSFKRICKLVSTVNRCLSRWGRHDAASRSPRGDQGWGQRPRGSAPKRAACCGPRRRPARAHNGPQTCIVISATRTPVPSSLKVSAGRSSHSPPRASTIGRRLALCRGPLAHKATRRPPGFNIVSAWVM